MADNVQLQRNIDVYTTPEDIAAHEQLFGMQRPKFETIHSLVAAIPNKTVVADVGCLTGIGSVSYREYDDVDTVHVFDASEELLRLAAEKDLVTHHWVCGETAAPVDDGSFDLLIASDIIEHILDTEFFISELIRIVRPGGHIVVTTPNLGWWINRFRLLAGRVPVCHPGVSSRFKKEERIDLNHIRINMTEEWRAFFEHHGLEVAALRGYRLNTGMRWFLRPIDRAITNPRLTFGMCFLMNVPSG